MSFLKPTLSSDLLPVFLSQQIPIPGIIRTAMTGEA